jgi:hypothetical protein
MASQELVRLRPSQGHGYTGFNSFKDFAFRRELWCTLVTQGHLGKYFLRFSCPAAVQLWSKYDLGIVHMPLVLQAYRMQELQGPRGFHQSLGGQV